MNKLSKKVIGILILFFIIIFELSSNVFAVESTNILKVIQQSSGTKELGNNQGSIIKSIIDSNQNTGEITIELSLQNIGKSDGEETAGSEIFFVIDNSKSMDFITTSGETRKEIIINNAKALAAAINEKAPDTKIGIVKFYGADGMTLANYLVNSSLLLGLTNDINQVLSTLDELKSSSTNTGTNIEGGLIRAEKNFTKTCQNKTIILMTDGVPNTSEGLRAGDDTTTEESLAVQDATKAKLQELDEQGINIISLMTGVYEEDGTTDNAGNEYTGNVEDDLRAIERIFGTEENPTAGKYYLAKTTEIEEIVQNNIYNEIMKNTLATMENIVLVDYFPTDIIKNFDFEYVNGTDLENVSKKIDENTNTITWKIESLTAGQTAVLRYKLKIKDINNEEILNKVIATNEKVEITYVDADEKECSVILDTSPLIQLTRLEQTSQGGTNSEPTDDTTIAPDTLPKAGTKIMIIYAIIAIIVLVVISKRCNKYKDIK